MLSDVFEKLILLVQSNIWILVVVVALLSGGVTYAVSKSTQQPSNAKQTIVDSSESNAVVAGDTSIRIDVSGAVKYPGIYSLPANSRVSDALALSGGVASGVAVQWFAQNVDLAQKLKDTQKLYIPFEWEVADSCSKDKLQDLVITSLADVAVPIPTIRPSIVPSSGPTGSQSQLVHINSDSQSSIETLPGIGAVYSQKIVDNRPYTNSGELVSKAKLSQSLVDKLTSLIDFK